MKKILFAILILLPVFSIQAQTKKAITHEDLWSLKRVGAPQISPDGNYVLVSVLEPSYDEKEKISDLWITTTDGKGTPRRLTTGKSSESGYSWSPDGKYIAFSAKREGDDVPQLYLLNFKEGGEAQRFTNLSTGASNPVWSPDGKRIAFLSEVFPGALTDSANKKIAADRKALKYKARVYTTYPIRNWDSWNEDKQVHLFVQDVSENSTAKDLFAGTEFVSKIGYSGEGMSLTWTPNGKQIVFNATENFTEAAYADVISNLYLISSNGSEPKKLTTDGNHYGSSQISNDGKWLYFLTNKSIPNSGFEYTLTRIGRTSFPEFGNNEILTADMDQSVNGYKLSADGNSIYFTVEQETADRFYMMNSEGKKRLQLTEVNGGSYPSFSVSNNDVLVAGYESATMPAEIVRIDMKKKNHVSLTSFNQKKLSELDLIPLKHFWMTSSKGKKIHSLMVMPPNFDPNKKYPLFVLIHGGPHIAMKDNFSYRWNYHLLAQPGYVLIMTNYTGSTGYGEKFAQDIQVEASASTSSISMTICSFFRPNCICGTPKHRRNARYLPVNTPIFTTN